MPDSTGGCGRIGTTEFTRQASAHLDADSLANLTQLLDSYPQQGSPASPAGG